MATLLLPPAPHDLCSHPAFSNLHAMSSSHGTEAGEGVGNAGQGRNIQKSCDLGPRGLPSLSPASPNPQSPTPLQSRAQTCWPLWNRPERRRHSVWLPSREEIKGFGLWSRYLGKLPWSKGNKAGGQHREGPSNLSQKGKKGARSFEQRGWGQRSLTGKGGSEGSAQQTAQALGILIRQSHCSTQRKARSDGGREGGEGGWRQEGLVGG